METEIRGKKRIDTAAGTYEDGERGHEPRSETGFQKLEKAKKWIFP